MTKLENVKISTQILVAFLVVASIGVGIAVVSAIKTRALAAQIREMAGGPMVNVEQFTKLNDNLNVIARDTRLFLVSWDPESREKSLEKISQMHAGNAVLLDGLGKSLPIGRTRDLFKVINENQIQYQAKVSEFVKLAMEGKNQAAGELLEGGLAKIQSEIFSALKESLDLQRQLVFEAGEGAVSDADRISVLLISMAVIAASIGCLTGWFMSRLLSRLIARILNISKRISSGDLTENISVIGTNEAAVILNALEEMQRSLVKVVTSVRTGSEGVATASAEIAQGNNDLSSRTESQASALQETVGSMAQLGDTVELNANNARLASDLAEAASNLAIDGGTVVGQVVETMKGIDDSSRRIFEIISVIDSIAFQTNILALNAAVEAARAGEQGRGFAVVASEVRSLAGRSAEAAKEIKALINTSVDRVNIGNDLVDQAGAKMSQLVMSVQRVAGIIVEISAASAHQSSDVAQLREAIAAIDQATQQNAALVEQMAAAASSLKGLASNQVAAVSIFMLPETQRSLPSI